MIWKQHREGTTHFLHSRLLYPMPSCYSISWLNISNPLISVRQLRKKLAFLPRQQKMAYFMIILNCKMPVLLPKKSCKIKQIGELIHVKTNFFLLVRSLLTQINSWSWSQIVCYECRTISFSTTEGLKQLSPM